MRRMVPGRAARVFSACAAAVLVVCGSVVPAPGQDRGRSAAEYSRREIRWAAGWINREVALFMARNIVTKIIAGDSAFEVHVGDPWYVLDFGQQGQFLQQLSRAREITGHSPFFVVRDDTSTDIVARVSGRGIEVALPGEGMFTYLPSGEAPAGPAD
jgi:hypothetical protein